MMKNFSFTTLLLCIPALLFGPLMALMPRGMMALVIYTALVLLPSLKKHWTDIIKTIDKQSFILLACAVGYTCLTALWSPNDSAGHTAFGLLYLCICCAIIFLTLPFIKPHTLDVLIKLFVTSWIIGLGLLCVECFFNHPIHRWYNQMDSNIAVYENVTKRMAGLFALSIWPFALWLKTKGKNVLSILSVLAFTSISIFLTNRSSLLGMVVGSGVLFFALYQAVLARWALTLLIGLGLFFIVPVSTVLPLVSPEITGQLFDSALARIKVWTVTSKHILEKPFFGHGIDASTGLQSDAPNSLGAGFFEPGVNVVSHHPHNIFLQLWLDFGMVGAILWGTLLLFLTYRMYKAHEIAQPYMIAAAFCSLMMLNTTFSLLQAWWLSGHIATAVMLALMSYNLSRKAAISGTSAGGISNSPS
ncbi:MAG: O-antigen ligase family protein [Alphaproteobacteria bacterium]|nr:O-antigen ligase family protein [Alphaproteobacteria bacterium]